MARALLKQRSLPTRYWGEAVVTAVHLLNRAPTKCLQGKTPYEAWHDKTPAVGHLRTFGCVAYTKDLTQLKKLDDRSRLGIFIDYADSAKAYRVLDPATASVAGRHLRRELRLGLGEDWRRRSSSEHGVRHRVLGDQREGRSTGRVFNNLLYSSTPTTAVAPTSPEPSPTTPTTSTTPTTPTTPSSSPAPGEYESGAGAATAPSTTTTPPTDQPQIELATPLEDDEDRLDAFYDDEPLWYRKMTNILGDVSSRPGTASLRPAPPHARWRAH
jgi:hypothetical protein